MRDQNNTSRFPQRFAKSSITRTDANSVLLIVTAIANQMILLEQKPDTTLLPVHVSQFGTTLPSKGRARYKSLL